MTGLPSPLNLSILNCQVSYAYLPTYIRSSMPISVFLAAYVSLVYHIPLGLPPHSVTWVSYYIHIIN